jgi:hypothetical protein
MSITDNVSQNLDGRQHGKTVEYQAHTPADKPRFQLGLYLSVPSENAIVLGMVELLRNDV